MVAARRHLGEEFVKVILTQPFETLPKYKPSATIGSASVTSETAADKECSQAVVRVCRNIPDLYTDTQKNIVLPSFAEDFWQNCIDRVEGLFPNDRTRVCAVGTPGTGKTCTTPLLLRMLLLQGSTVVYIRRSIDYSSWYYKFIPNQNANKKHDGEIPYTVNVYPEESNGPFDFPSLEEPSTYLVVDPGTSNDSCDPEEDFLARVIIISSPNEKHWGANEFSKHRGSQSGVFHYFPLWNLTDVLSGMDGFDSAVRLSPQQLADRYRQVGGVPRHLFADTEEYQNILETQVNALEAVEAIEPWQALRIASGKMDPIGHMDNGTPKSAVIGIELGDSEYGRFVRDKAVPISTAVAEKLYSLHIQTLWDDMVLNERSLVFASYLRTVLATVGSEMTVRLIEKGHRTSGRSTDRPPNKIGGYSGIQIVPGGTSIVKAAVESPTANILFYSSDPRNALVDFVCRDDEGNILAFQATTSPTQTIDKAEIASLEDEVGDRGLMLYYLYPAQSEPFRTDPVTLTTRFCWIFHVRIPKPLRSQRQT